MVSQSSELIISKHLQRCPEPVIGVSLDPSTIYRVTGRGRHKRPHRLAVLKACVQTLVEIHGFQGQ